MACAVSSSSASNRTRSATPGGSDKNSSRVIVSSGNFASGAVDVFGQVFVGVVTSRRVSAHLVQRLLRVVSERGDRCHALPSLVRLLVCDGLLQRQGALGAARHPCRN